MSRQRIAGRARRALAGAGLALALAAACGSDRYLPGPDVIARLDGVEIRYRELELYLEANLGESGGELASEALSSLLDQFLTERLLARSAAEKGLVAPGASSSEAVEALLAAEPGAPVTETAISAYYRERQEQFRVAEQLELRLIRTDDRIVAERARREIAAGVPFAAVARRLSVDPTAERGGEQGALGRDDLPPALVEPLFRLKEGAISDVIATSDGFLVFQLVRRVPERIRTLDEARAEILQQLAGARADRAYQRLVTEARSRYAVELFDGNLPFAYKGSFPITRPYEKS